MRINTLIAVFALSVLGAGAANAAEICNARTFQKYGETRAFFQDVIAGCDKDKNCYAATHVADNGQGYAYRQQIRVRRNAGEPTNRLFFVGVDPMPAAKGQFSISVDDKFFDIGGHSLLALSVIARIEKKYGVRISPLDMLMNTLEQIATKVAFSGERAGASETEAAAHKVAPTSDQQRGAKGGRLGHLISKLQSGFSDV